MFYTERQKDRKTERQKDRKTERQKDRKIQFTNKKPKFAKLIRNFSKSKSFIVID